MLGFGVIVVIVQVLGKYMIIRYLDPLGEFWVRGFGVQGSQSCLHLLGIVMKL